MGCAERAPDGLELLSASEEKFESGEMEFVESVMSEGWRDEVETADFIRPLDRLKAVIGGEANRLAGQTVAERTTLRPCGYAGEDERDVGRGGERIEQHHTSRGA